MTQEPSQGPYRPQFGRALRRAAGDAYDHLTLIGPATFIWGLVISLPAAAGFALAKPPWAWLGAGAAWLAAALASAGLLHMAHRVALREPASLLDMARGARRFAWPGLRLAALLTVIAGIILFSSLFYLNVLRESRIGAVIGFICLYLFGLFCFLAQYAYPLLIAQGLGALAALKRSALLAMDNFGFTLLLALLLLAVTVAVALPVAMRIPYLSGFSALVFLFGYAGFFALLANHALLELLKKY